MNVKTIIFFAVLACCAFNLPAQNIGIGTTTPHSSALLHVDLGLQSNRGLLVTGTLDAAAVLPNLGAGSRLMFYPGKAAFRAGYVSGSSWDNFSIGQYSAALGRNSNASGLAATAMGNNTAATGDYATALGNTSIAAGESSVALGVVARTLGLAAFATGFYTDAREDYSTAMGYNTTASYEAAMATGANSVASGYASTAMGNITTASGGSSTAMGGSTIAEASTSTAMGAGTRASGVASTSIGRNTIAKGFASTVIGQYNDSILTSNQTNISSVTPLFIIGNGDANTDRTNAMVVLKNGYVGLGSNAPTENLVINDPVNPTLELQSAGIEKGFFQLSGNNVRLGTYSTNSLGNLTVRLDGADRFIIFPSGNATLTGTLTQNSDARLKQNIQTITHALDKVKLLKGRAYNWKPEVNKDSSLQIGFIAQEVEEVLPELVATGTDGTRSVAYQNMVPVLVEAIKTLSQKVEQLEQTIHELKKKNLPADK
jgi:hypothetical protein